MHRMFVFVLFWGIFSGAVLAEPKRIALVIGNADYTNAGRLANPANDADDIAAVLDEVLDFKVLKYKNLNHSEMLGAVSAFNDQLSANPGAIALFYYAGHGIQIPVGKDRKNFLIPVNASIEKEYEVQAQGVDTAVILSAMQSSGTQIAVALLDACRNNPFERSFRGSKGRGLARVDALSGVLIGYATAPGEVASDGDGRNSPYAKALKQWLAQPGYSVPDVLTEVGQAVKQTTGGEQEPWLSISPVPRICFAGCGVVQKVDPQAAEKAFWEETKQCGKAACYQAYLDQYPQGLYVALAQAQIKPQTVVIPRLEASANKPASSLGALPRGFVAIKGGCFQMGSPDDEKGRSSNETQHEACVEDFALAKTEVTVAEFRRFVDATAYQTDAEKKGSCYAYKDGKWGTQEGYSWRKVGFQQDDNHPVVCVSWNDAVAYTEWLGKGYRLPTEAEWEYAARAKTQTARFWGDRADEACTYANVHDESSKAKNDFGWTHHACDDGYQYTAPVGRFQTNDFGLSDMLGNVWEWTCSAYEKDGNKTEKICIDVNANDSRSRVLRGGSWGSLPGFLRSADRNWLSADFRDINVGFRILFDSASPRT